MEPPENSESRLRPRLWAHRGGRGGGVENTLAAFDMAYALGCDGVEFDVQLCSDGRPVVFHDDDLERLAGLRRRTDSVSSSILRSLPLRQAGEAGAASAPSLDAFLRRFGRRPFYLELKVPEHRRCDDAYVSALLEAVDRSMADYSLAEGSFLASFHEGILHKASRRFPASRLARIYESIELTQGVPAGALPWGKVSFPYGSLEAVLRNPPQAEWVVWDLQDGREMARAAQAGASGLCADDAAEMIRQRERLFDGAGG